jgi:hypothetical protein
VKYYYEMEWSGGLVVERVSSKERRHILQVVIVGNVLIGMKLTNSQQRLGRKFVDDRR